ncbi:MAG: Hpt domain-containing protein [Proteobacteria bacterium]|nr:Hpt domain-containing protein [Pseudomonadota bacterium]
MQEQLPDADTASTCQLNEAGIKLRDKCLKPGVENEAAQQAIANAEKALDKLSVNFDDWMATESKNLTAARDAARAAGFSPDTLGVLFQAAHNLKGQASTLGYPFADEICASLCRLIDKIPDKSRLPLVLLDQHVDAVRALVAEAAKGTDNPKASVLARRLQNVTSDFLAQEFARPHAA